MRKICISKITGNEILAKPIYDLSGRLLLSKNTLLKCGYKTRLTQMGILSVYIEDELSKGINVEDFISDETRNETKTLIKKEFNNFINGKIYSAEKIINCIEDILDDILSKEDLLVNVIDIKSKNQYLYEHSVNVCVLSLIMGINLNYSRFHLKELATGALFHDVGKLITPKDILNKNIKDLTDEELNILKKHPFDGYEILNNKSDISYISKAIVLMHHEHCDGNGFPLGLEESSIHETVRIVSICDTFDNLTSDFSGYKKVNVYEALEYLVAMSGTLFDKKLVKLFMKNVAAYPSGSIVKLNTGYYGIVSKQNKQFPLRPVLNIILDKNKNKISTPFEVDLSTETTLFIVKIINNV